MHRFRDALPGFVQANHRPHRRGAEVVGMLGFERLREDERQPGSYLFQLGSPHNPANRQLHHFYVHGADSTNSVPPPSPT